MDKISVKRVAKQAYALLATSKVDGHTDLRQFIQREAPGGSIVQAFWVGEKVGGHQFLRIAELAKLTHAANLRNMEASEELLVARTEVDSLTRLVQNNYLLPDCGASASVEDLRKAVQRIAVLADNLTGFASSPAALTAH